MAAKKAFPLRISAHVLEAMQRWADQELRSVNAQVEYVLRQALRRAGRLREDEDDTRETGSDD
ncbi:MAG TPA: Arc family DNA binding domain-containing protein [Xanthomonadaceae bacterium]|nr:Arc family DNA binding domain-containing protein [Xanthomonadaceae bacterium]